MESEREIWREEGERIGLEKGEQHTLQLMQLLIDAGRDAEMKRVLVDEEYRKQLYREFGIIQDDV